jgi:hypothetical protein
MTDVLILPYYFSILRLARRPKKTLHSVLQHATEPTLVSAVLRYDTTDAEIYSLCTLTVGVTLMCSRNDTALVIVDPQVDFTQPNGALPCIDTGPDSNLWPEIAALQAKHFASVFVTRDWHPEVSMREHSIDQSMTQRTYFFISFYCRTTYLLRAITPERSRLMSFL